MLQKRTFNVVWVTRTNNIEFDIDMDPHTTVAYDGSRIVVRKTEK